MSKGISIAGRTNRSDKHDYYQTPPEAVEGLLKVESFKGSIPEPCSGAGAISKAIKGSGCYVVMSSDIRTDVNVYGYKGVSIFDLTAKTYDNIITNPPYNNAQAIIESLLS